MPDADIDRIHSRLDRLEGIARERGEQVGVLAGDIREIRALLQTYATTNSVYESLAPLQEGMHTLQQSGVLLAREVQTIAHSFEELTQQVRKVIAMHEQSLQDRARTDQAKAEREREAAEQREIEARAKHELQMQTLRDEAAAREKAIAVEKQDRKFMNRLRQNWLPLLGALLGVLLGFGTIVEKIRALFEWIGGHWQ